MRCLSSNPFCAPPDGRVAAAAPVLSERDTAQLLTVSTRTLQRWRLEGGGPAFVKLTGARVGYMRADLDVWLASRRFESTSAVTAGRPAELIR